MKQKLLTFTMLLMFSVGIWAQKAAPRLVVWQKSGDKVYYELADQPETTFEDGLLVISTKKTTIEYQLGDILRYTYEGAGTSDIDLLATEHSVSISKEGDSVTLRNLREGSTVSLYAANGILVEQFTAHDGQPLTVSLGTRPAGLYILKAGSETIKMMKP